MGQMQSSAGAKFPFLLLINYVLLLVALSAEFVGGSPFDCLYPCRCARRAVHPVCAVNGRTFPNQCFLDLYNEHGAQRGRYLAKDRNGPCHRGRNRNYNDNNYKDGAQESEKYSNNPAQYNNQKVEDVKEEAGVGVAGSPGVPSPSPVLPPLDQGSMAQGTMDGRGQQWPAAPSVYNNGSPANENPGVPFLPYSMQPLTLAAIYGNNYPNSFSHNIYTNTPPKTPPPPPPQLNTTTPICPPTNPLPVTFPSPPPLVPPPPNSLSTR